ncbi:MAG TPA: 2-dehydropantoate 2-reductase [Planctomycetota bacterium]|nr:2-dehydropantoate 2-reductase [Planctomycetota bacterium]
MRIVILGAGAVGGYFGGMLARAGEDVFFIARGKQLDAMRSRGLRIEKHNGSFSVPVRVSDRPRDAGRVDVILVCVKTYDTGPACDPWKGTDATVVTLQNGLGNRAVLSRYFPTESIVEGVAYVASEVTEPGIIQWAAAGRTIIGPSKISEDLKARFDRAEAPCEISENIEQAVWEKLVANAVFNVMATVERCSLGDLLLEPRRELCERAVDELTAVAAAHGIVVRPDARERSWQFCRDHGTFPSSTQQDLAKGDPLETEALSGELVRRARAVGVPAPTHDMLYRKLQGMARS